MEALEFANDIEAQDTSDEFLEEWARYMDEELSILRAAEELEVSPGTLSAAIRKGELSCRIDGTGEFCTKLTPRWELYVWAGERKRLLESKQRMTNRRRYTDDQHVARYDKKFPKTRKPGEKRGRKSQNFTREQKIAWSIKDLETKRKKAEIRRKS